MTKKEKAIPKTSKYHTKPSIGVPGGGGPGGGGGAS